MSLDKAIQANQKRFEKQLSKLNTKLDYYKRMSSGPVSSDIHVRRTKEEIKDLKKRLKFVNKHGYKF